MGVYVTLAASSYNSLIKTAMNNFLLHNLRPSYCLRDKTTAITFSVVFHLGPLQRGVRSYQNVVNIATKTICLAYRPSHSERTARLVYCIVCVCVCVCVMDHFLLISQRSTGILIYPLMREFHFQSKTLLLLLLRTEIRHFFSFEY